MSDTNWSNETQPLLCHDTPKPLESLSDRTSSDLAIAVPSEAQTPLPKVQLALLCILRTLDPMCYFQIFPYINQFVSDLHVTKDPSKVGFYSGLVESAFAFSQLLAIYPWGYLSDRYGRRPVVLIGVMGLAITTLLFGLSKNFVIVMLTRALGGIASGNVTVIPSMLIEITDKTNQAQAFPFFGVWWPVGAIIGPLLRGLLSNPSTRYPSYFDCKFFREWRYSLPCLIVACFTLISFVVAWFFLRETMNSRTCRESTASGHNDIHSPSSSSEAGTTYNVRQLLAIPIIHALCVSSFALSFLSAAFDVLFVLFCYSPILSGGLAFSPSEIGFALSTSGIMAAVLQGFFMPPILRRVDHAVMYHFCMKLWPYVFLSLPLLNIIARSGLDQSGQLPKPIVVVLWISIALVLSIARVAFLAYSINMLIVKKHMPNSASLGSTTGLMQFCICLARAFSPVYASSLFAISQSNINFLGRYLWVIVMTLMGFTSNSFSKRIVIESSKS